MRRAAASPNGPAAPGGQQHGHQAREQQLQGHGPGVEPQRRPDQERQQRERERQRVERAEDDRDRHDQRRHLDDVLGPARAVRSGGRQAIATGTITMVAADVGGDQVAQRREELALVEQGRPGGRDQSPAPGRRPARPRAAVRSRRAGSAAPGGPRRP